MESNFIKEIVEDVLKRLSRKHPFEVKKELVGIEKKYDKIESLLEIGTNDVRTLVLWGMGGIGKTTLAKHLYGRLCSQFERTCFIENIREESNKHGLKFVRNKFFSTLLELPLNAPYVETPIFKNKLAHERSLIVLDDVATLEQAENFNIVNNCLGEGSRVIITTRDMQICSQFDECEIYKFEKMNADESLQLFCWNAFGEKIPKYRYDNLSDRAIFYCRGNPLALKELGANFRTKKSKEAWKSELEKLKKNPNRRIHDVLKLSFDDLDRTQQAIFLDIACNSGLHVLYKSLDNKDYIIAIWNACNFFPQSGLEVLLDKTLIYFYKEQHSIKMHDLLKEMGRETVMNESVNDPGRRSRLWDPKDVYDVLKYNKGTEVVEVIEFDTSRIENLYLSSDSFKSMTNLRHLHINTTNREIRLHFLEGLEWLSDKLRHLHWDSFPLESLPSTFCAEWLVQLNMQHSKLKKLWDGIQRLDNLIVLDLAFSKDLIELPDLSKAPNLQIVILSGCKSLRRLHPSIFSILKLTELDLSGCEKIESLKNNIHSKSLQILDLSNSSLAEFSVTSEETMKLSLWDAVVHGFSSFMLCNKKFTEVHLTGCTQINTSSLWFILDGTPSLKLLCLRNCHNLETLPDNIHNNSMLETLDLDHCRKLKSLPKLPVSLQYFTAQNCIHLETNSIQRPMLENMLHKLRSPENMLHIKYLSRRDWYIPSYHMGVSFFPGSQIPSEFYFHTTETSLDIPLIPKYGLSGFIICFILSGEVNIGFGKVFCTIYQHTQEIERYGTWYMTKTKLISDHVWFGIIRCYNSDWVKVGSESRSDYYNLSFLFNFGEHRGKGARWIKGCGVIPVYDSKQCFVLEDGRTSGVE